VDSMRSCVTISSGRKLAAAAGALGSAVSTTDLGEIDATTGTLDLENAIVNGGTLGGPGTIATATGNIDSTLNGVTIGSGSKVAAERKSVVLAASISDTSEIGSNRRPLTPEHTPV